jgi:hypothetical protein
LSADPLLERGNNFWIELFSRQTDDLGRDPWVIWTGGDAALLHRSIERILSLPDATRLFMCHDYMPGGREVRWETTVAAERAENIHLAGTDADGFIAKRRERDRTLGYPALLIPSVQVNMRGGELPPAEANGVRYLKVPIDRL